MSYHFTATLHVPFDTAVERTITALQESGFGVLTQIDIKATLKKKLDVDTLPYTILGACNPGFAWQALQAEPKIGTMLPCNVIVQQNEDGSVDVSAIDPIASMQAVDNPSLGEVATKVHDLLKGVVEKLTIDS